MYFNLRSKNKVQFVFNKPLDTRFNKEEGLGGFIDKVVSFGIDKTKFDSFFTNEPIRTKEEAFIELDIQELVLKDLFNCNCLNYNPQTENAFIEFLGEEEFTSEKIEEFLNNNTDAIVKVPFEKITLL